MIVIVHGKFVVDWTDLQLSIAGAILLAELLVDLMTKVLLKLWFVVAIVAMKAKAEAEVKTFVMFGKILWPAVTAMECSFVVIVEYFH